MQTWNSVAEWLDRRRTLEKQTIGFVPTMGALHRGHAALVEQCRRENEIVVVSIFVNPSQFNDPRDLERYPRTLEQDLRLLAHLKTDEVIAPSASEMYPNGMSFRVEPAGSSQGMEGLHRPGFFAGVATVVLKLLNLVRADRAYFGEKDYQQWKVIAEMTKEFFLPTEIIVCPTIREESGLAESSRNKLLGAEARQRAATLFRVLSTAADPTEARTLLGAEGLLVDYVEEHWGRRFGAAFLEGVRLIDNVPMRETAHAARP
jgi:pantoate--beta-alanine ligase